MSFLKLTTVLIIFWNLKMSYQMFLSQHVKRNVIITSKMVNTSWLTRSQMMWDWRKFQNSMELKCSVQSSSQNENIVNTSKNLLKTSTFPLDQYFTWNLKFFSYIFHTFFFNGSSYQILRCAMLYPWPRVKKCWLSVIIHFKQYCVIDSLLISNFH